MLQHTAAVQYMGVMKDMDTAQCKGVVKRIGAVDNEGSFHYRGTGRYKQFSMGT